MQGNQTRNPVHSEIFNIKGDARRLRAALQEQHIEVSHSAALGLVAKSKGFRNWEELEGRLAGQVPNAGSSQPADAAVVPQDAPAAGTQYDLRWLDWLEAKLRTSGQSEEDLDDLAYESHGDEVASEINNQGMYYQLKARLMWHLEYPGVSLDAAKRHVLTDVNKLLDNPVEEPSRATVQPRAIPMRVNVAAGSASEKEIWVDALEWFALATRDDIEALVRAGLHNTDVSDGVALELMKSSLFAVVREQLTELLEYGRAAQQFDESLVGITCDIDKSSVWNFMTYMLECGAEYSEETLDRMRC